MNIQENISLKSLNTFAIAKKARFFVEVRNLDELKDAIDYGKKRQLQTLILGGGSNILLTKDLEALIIKISITGIHLITETPEAILVKVGAGVVWHDWVRYSLDQGWTGLENLSLIPGTVGAAPMQNIGAYGVEIQDVFYQLEALHRPTGKLETFTREECEFGYRDSVFKNRLKDQYVICSVTFSLARNAPLHTEYGAIQETLKQMGISKITSQHVSNAVIQIRQSKLPDPAKIGNAGSFFKNPSISIHQFEDLQKTFPNMPGYPQEDKVKVPAGWLIEQAGWKGVKKGSIGVHDRQALVLVNFGDGDGKEIANLAAEIQLSVQEKFGIFLHPEVNFL